MAKIRTISKFDRLLKTKFSLFVFVFCTLTMLLLGFIIGSRYDDVFVSGNSLAPLKETHKALRANFDGELDDKKLIEGASRGMVEAAGDPYTAYFDKKEVAEFNKDLEGTFEGIGAELGKKDGKLVVVSTLEGNPARKAGLQPNDIIATVNGDRSDNWTVDKAVSKIRGAKGTQVKLTVIRGEEEIKYSITRASINSPSVTTQERGDVGIVSITRFGDDTSSLVRKAAKQFADKKAVVVDLRGNGGGYLLAAKDVASLWLDRGDIVVTERSGGKVQQTHKADGNNMLSGKKTVVLINQGTASASEILAGALQDHGKAILVGEKSFGKGSVQDLIDLPNGAKLKVTIAKWYTPSGKNIGQHGVTPDVKVVAPATDDSDNDTQLERALDIAN